MSDSRESIRYRIAEADFLLSVDALHQLPPADRPEIVFAGRSNSGKSTLLNSLCGQKALARVSKTPGRTQLLNFFTVRMIAESVESGERRDFETYFVDLPGYGHANVPKAMRKHWDKLISSYLLSRETVSVLTLLSDSRRDVSDQESWFFHLDIPAEKLFVLTKTDKLSNNKLASCRTLAADSLDVSKQSVFLTSAGAKKKRGVTELCDAIGALVDPAE